MNDGMIIILILVLIGLGYCIGFLMGVCLSKGSGKTTEKTLEDMKSRFPGKQVEEIDVGYNIIIAGMSFTVDKEGKYLKKNNDSTKNTVLSKIIQFFQNKTTKYQRC